MSIIRGNADEYQTDAQTVSGRDICIRINEQGYYRIDIKGAGDKLALCDEMFTSLSEARRAVAAYVAEHRLELEKKARLAEIAERDYSRRKNGKTNTE